MTNANDELLSIFWEEVSDHLGVLNESLLRVEMAQGEERRGLLKEMNRVAHSMKGAARAVGLGLIETIAHYLEEVFHLALDFNMTITPAIADTLYDSLDLIQNVMSNVENDNEAVTRVLMALEGIVTSHVPDETAVWTPPDVPEPALNTTEMQAVPIPHDRLMPLPDAASNTQTMLVRTLDETIRVSIEKLDQLMAQVSELNVLKMRGELRFKRTVELQQMLNRWQREWRSVRTGYIRLIRRVQDSSQAAAPPPELITILRFLEVNQRYLQNANRDMLHLYQALAQDQLTLLTLTDDLQDRVADLRMMPFETVASGMQRLVRDLARDLKKQVVLDIIGAHVEIDKAVLDALREPLMHLIRNSVDHGIEPPLERSSLGKPSFGLIELTVEQRGSEILIRIKDDGRGLNPEVLRQKAIQRGLMNTAEAEALDDDSARMLIFQAGFSTQDTVNAISGRGLGMDIVRERVESLRGRISVSSAPGHGMTTTINVPVSLTRIRCVLLRVGDEEYAIPSVMIARMERIDRSQIYTAKGQPMAKIGERPVPVFVLGDVLSVPTMDAERPQADVVVLQALERMVAFEVDDLYSELELVLKPLGRELINTPFVAGAALLGSGAVVVVLDANDLVRVASGDTMPRRNRMPALTYAPSTRRLRVLVVDDSITTRTLEKNILETAGFEVVVAIDGLEAWTNLLEINPDIIISDVEMPQMTGLELARRVKSDARTRDIPLILLTSLGKPEQREAGLAAGADAYLVKSQFDQSELLATIQSVL
ncbi:hybrid sensor histidine kinase/response regulator [Aggregatilineales bacterium SYSU G02658]